MIYGNYKLINVLTPSLINKFGNTANIIRYQLQDGDTYTNINDSNASVIIKNVTGYLFDIPTVVSAGGFSIDFSDSGLANLPSGNYEFQLNAHVNDQIAKYPDFDFVPFTITPDARVSPNGLIPQITFDKVLNAVDEKVKYYTNTISKGNTGDKGNEGEKGEKGDNGSDGKNATFEYLNVIDFGADPNGIIDSTKAFNDAVNSNISDSVYIPNGIYIISEPVFLKRKTLRGQSKYRTILMSTGKSALTFQDNAVLEDLTINITRASDNSSAIELGAEYINGNGLKQYTGARFNSISRIIIIDSSTHFNTCGINLEPKLYVDMIANTGVWGNVLNDISMSNVGIGIKIDAQNRGWANGNTFRDVLIKGYQSYGVLLDSSVKGGMGIQVNTFESIQVENVPDTPAMAIAFAIKAGNWNFFSNCSHWNDSHHNNEEIISLFFGKSIQSNSYYSVYDNSFLNSKLEGNISGDFKEISLNKIDTHYINVGVPIEITKNDVTDNYKNNYIIENILNSELIDEYNEIPELSPIKISNNSNNINLEHNLFGKSLLKIKETKFMSYSVRFSGNIGLVDSKITITDINGSTTIIKEDVSFTEKNENDEITYTVFIDFNRYNIGDFINVVFTFNNVNSDFSINQIYASNTAVKNIDRYGKNRIIGKYIVKKLSKIPENWRDIGIFLPSGYGFDQQLLSIFKIGESFVVRTPIIE